MRVLLSPNRRVLAKAVIEEMAAFRGQSPFARGYLLVPEQQKAGMERLYFAGDPQRSLMLEEVLSFRRFAFRLAEIGGGGANSVVSPGLQTYLLGQILTDLRGDLESFREGMFKPSFLGKIMETIGDFLRYRVSAEMLADTAAKAEQVGEKEFAARIRDYGKVLKQYKTTMRNNHLIPGELTMEDLAERLEELLRQLRHVGDDWAKLPFPWNQYRFLQTTQIWIHGFGVSRNFTPQEFRIVDSLQRLCADVLLTVEEDTESQTPYAVAHKAGADLLQDLQARYPNLQVEICPEEDFTPTYRFHRFTDSRSEVRWTAGEIKRILAEDRVNPSEIGVALADPNLEAEMQQALRELAIPCYTADSIQGESSACERFFRTLSSVLLYGWSREYLIPLLRNPYLEISDSDVDRLENFWLSRGINGNRIWDDSRYSPEWQPGLVAAAEQNSGESEEEEGEEEPEADPTEKKEDKSPAYQAYLNYMAGLRDRALAGIRQLILKMRPDQSAHSFAAILLRFIRDQKIADRIELRIESLKAEFRDDAEFEAKTWNQVLTVLQDFYDLDSEAKMSIEDFLYYFTEAVQVSPVSKIPATGNQVVLGSIRILANEQVSRMFLLGADQRNIPGKGFDNGLLSSFDRRFLNEFLESEYLPDIGLQRIYAEESHLYGVIRLPEESVQLSYSGPTERQSVLFADLCRETKGTVEEHLNVSSLRDPRMADPERAWSVFYASSQSEDLQDLQRYLAEVQSPVLQITEKEGTHRDLSLNGELLLEPALTQPLIGEEPVWSISQLERYSACPYSFLSGKLLGLAEREEWTPDAASYGTLVHAALEVLQGEWEEALERSEASEDFWTDQLQRIDLETIERAFELAKAKDPTLGLFWEQGQSFATRHKALRATLEAAKTSLKEYADGQGRWRPYKEEWAFGPEAGLPFQISGESGETVSFRGRVDRIDVTLDQSTARLIDYKSGSKKVSYDNLFHGLDLQLPIYLSAFEALNPSFQVSDAAYAPVSPGLPFTLAEPDLSGKTEGKIYTKLKFKGIELAEEDLQELMQHSLRQAGRLVSQMNSGDFSARPRTTNKAVLPCRFCEYSALCGLKNGHIEAVLEENLTSAYDSLVDSGQIDPTQKKKDQALKAMLYLMQEDSEGNS